MEIPKHSIIGFRRSTKYAILALHCLAFCNRPRFRLPDIAACTGIPSAYLSKVLVGLRESGFVDAKRGAAGGYKLSRPADQISILSVIEAIEGIMISSEINMPQPLATVLQKAEDTIHSSLEALTLDDLAPTSKKPIEIQNKQVNPKPGSV